MNLFLIYLIVAIIIFVIAKIFMKDTTSALYLAIGWPFALLFVFAIDWVWSGK